ncbi:MAG: tetratricopeptide repeat protein [Bacteroidales bacterium]|nr:tetratricopeptide repeat protein [Bacteroidales bacterium]
MKRLFFCTSLFILFICGLNAQSSTDQTAKAKTLIQRAQRYAAEHEYASAAQYLQQAYDMSPTTFDCNTTQLLGVSYYMMEDNPMAIQFLELAVKCESKKDALARMYIYLSDSYLDMDDYTKAADNSLKAISNSADDKAKSVLYEELANMHFENKENDSKAADKTIDAMQKSVAHYLKHLSVTEDEVMQGLVKNEALGNKYFNLTWFASALNMRSIMQNSIIKSALAGNKDAIGYCQENNIAYKDAIVEPPSSSKDDNVATALIEEALLHASKEQYASIIPKLEKAYRMSPAMFDGKTYQLMGLSYFKNKNYNLAIKYFERAVQFDADKKDLYFIYGTLGDAYYNQKNYPNALINAEKALYLANDDNDVLKCSLRLANIFYAQKNYESTVDSYQNAIRYYLMIHSISNADVKKGKVKDKFLGDTHMKLTSLLNDLKRGEESDHHLEMAALFGNVRAVEILKKAGGKR